MWGQSNTAGRTYQRPGDFTGGPLRGVSWWGGKGGGRVGGDWGRLNIQDSRQQLAEGFTYVETEHIDYKQLTEQQSLIEGKTDAQFDNRFKKTAKPKVRRFKTRAERNKQTGRGGPTGRGTMLGLKKSNPKGRAHRGLSKRSKYNYDATKLPKVGRYYRSPGTRRTSSESRSPSSSGSRSRSRSRSPSASGFKDPRVKKRPRTGPKMQDKPRGGESRKTFEEHRQKHWFPSPEEVREKKKLKKERDKENNKKGFRYDDATGERLFIDKSKTQKTKNNKVRAAAFQPEDEQIAHFNENKRKNRHLKDAMASGEEEAGAMASGEEDGAEGRQPLQGSKDLFVDAKMVKELDELYKKARKFMRDQNLQQLEKEGIFEKIKELPQTKVKVTEHEWGQFVNEHLNDDDLNMPLNKDDFSEKTKGEKSKKKIGKNKEEKVNTSGKSKEHKPNKRRNVKKLPRNTGTESSQNEHVEKKSSSFYDIEGDITNSSTGIDDHSERWKNFVSNVEDIDGNKIPFPETLPDFELSDGGETQEDVQLNQATRLRENLADLKSGVSINDTNVSVDHSERWKNFVSNVKDTDGNTIPFPETLPDFELSDGEESKEDIKFNLDTRHRENLGDLKSAIIYNNEISTDIDHSERWNNFVSNVKDIDGNNIPFPETLPDFELSDGEETKEDIQLNQATRLRENLTDLKSGVSINDMAVSIDHSEIWKNFVSNVKDTDGNTIPFPETLPDFELSDGEESKEDIKFNLDTRHRENVGDLKSAIIYNNEMSTDIDHSERWKNFVSNVKDIDGNNIPFPETLPDFELSDGEETKEDIQLNQASILRENLTDLKSGVNINDMTVSIDHSERWKNFVSNVKDTDGNTIPFPETLPDFELSDGEETKEDIQLNQATRLRENLADLKSGVNINDMAVSIDHSERWKNFVSNVKDTDGNTIPFPDTLPDFELSDGEESKEDMKFNLDTRHREYLGDLKSAIIYNNEISTGIAHSERWKNFVSNVKDIDGNSIPFPETMPDFELSDGEETKEDIQLNQATRLRDYLSDLKSGVYRHEITGSIDHSERWKNFVSNVKDIDGNNIPFPETLPDFELSDGEETKEELQLMENILEENLASLKRSSKDYSSNNHNTSEAHGLAGNEKTIGDGLFLGKWKEFRENIEKKIGLSSNLPDTLPNELDSEAERHDLPARMLADWFEKDRDRMNKYEESQQTIDNDKPETGNYKTEPEKKEMDMTTSSYSPEKTIHEHSGQMLVNSKDDKLINEEHESRNSEHSDSANEEDPDVYETPPEEYLEKLNEKWKQFWEIYYESTGIKPTVPEELPERDDEDGMFEEDDYELQHVSHPFLQSTHVNLTRTDSVMEDLKKEITTAVNDAPTQPVAAAPKPEQEDKRIPYNKQDVKDLWEIFMRRVDGDPYKALDEVKVIMGPNQDAWREDLIKELKTYREEKEARWKMMTQYERDEFEAKERWKQIQYDLQVDSQAGFDQSVEEMGDGHEGNEDDGPEVLDSFKAAFDLWKNPEEFDMEKFKATLTPEEINRLDNFEDYDGEKANEPWPMRKKSSLFEDDEEIRYTEEEDELYDKPDKEYLEVDQKTNAGVLAPTLPPALPSPPATPTETKNIPGAVEDTIVNPGQSGQTKIMWNTFVNLMKDRHQKGLEQFMTEQPQDVKKRVGCADGQTQEKELWTRYMNQAVGGSSGSSGSNGSWRQSSSHGQQPTGQPQPTQAQYRTLDNSNGGRYRPTTVENQRLTIPKPSYSKYKVSRGWSFLVNHLEGLKSGSISPQGTVGVIDPELERARLKEHWAKLTRYTDYGIQTSRDKTWQSSHMKNDAQFSQPLYHGESFYRQDPQHQKLYDHLPPIREDSLDLGVGFRTGGGDWDSHRSRGSPFGPNVQSISYAPSPSRPPTEDGSLYGHDQRPPRPSPNDSWPPNLA